MDTVYLALGVHILVENSRRNRYRTELCSSLYIYRNLKVRTRCTILERTYEYQTWKGQSNAMTRGAMDWRIEESHNQH